MKDSEIFERVQGIIADITDIDREAITKEASLINDLDLSSLEIMSIVSEFEANFSIRVPEKDLRGFVQVQDFIKYIGEKTV